MPNLFDYLDWRGDLSFAETPLCEVDNLVFSLLSYIDLDDIVPPPHGGTVTLREAAKEYFFVRDPEARRPLGLIVPSEIVTLFRHMAEVPRYAELRLEGYVNEICETREMQFSALTVRLSDDEVFVIFRGTDDTIVGWREDFNLSYMDEVPSQRKAVDYLNTLDLPPDTRLWVGGHSKGGNLAVWGVVHADERVHRRLVRVWSNDGPGFSEEMIRSEAYRALADRISIILPEDSVIGLLLAHDEAYTVVKSTRRGLRQHDALSWEVKGAAFIRTEGLSRRGIRSDTVVRDRIAAMTREERKTFVRLLFTVLESTGAKTLTDLHRTSVRTVTGMIRSVVELSREDQEIGLRLIAKLFLFKDIPAQETAHIHQSASAQVRRAPIRVEFGFRRRG